MIDKTRVTCIKWVPGHGDTFIVSHASGHLYTYQVINIVKLRSRSSSGENLKVYLEFLINLHLENETYLSRITI